MLQLHRKERFASAVHLGNTNPGLLRAASVPSSTVLCKDRMGTVLMAAVCRAWSLPEPLVLEKEGLEFLSPDVKSLSVMQSRMRTAVAGDVLPCLYISASKASAQGPTLGRLPAAS